MSLSACNPDRGPEYTTPAEFGEVTVSPQTMAFDSEVRVKVSVSCPYGLRNVCILSVSYTHLTLPTTERV